ncbi:hypothetical protein GCM10025787_17340 [Saccharopolyspora rosea]
MRRAAAALALLLGLTGCSGGVVPEPQVVQAEARADLSEQPEATTFADLADAPQDPDPRGRTDGVVLHVKRELAVRDAPGGSAFAKLPATQLDNPTWVPVVAERGQWARVLLPSRPNGTSGWVWTGDPDLVEKARSPYLVDVDVNARRLEVFQDGRSVGEWVVGVGKAKSPTPRGRTFIMAAIEETVTHFSPIILPLGTHSETFNSYGGGPGTVALHGWPDPAVFGRADSDGCVRVPADALHLLSTLPLGTLVVLR